MNVGNAVAEKMSEWEVAATIATEGIDVAKVSQPECLDYIDAMEAIVKRFGGGKGAPMVMHLAAFSHQFGTCKRLGKDFITSVVDAKFEDVPHVIYNCPSFL